MKYFVFKHKLDNFESEIEPYEFLKILEKGKYVISHYEYGYHDSNKVSNNWNILGKMEKGDVIILAIERWGKNKFYGFGYIKQPRKFKDIPNNKLDFDKIFKNEYSGEWKEYKNKYIKGKYKGIVYFKDKCFYTNLYDKEFKYGPQRVDVDYYKIISNGIKYKVEREYRIDKNVYLTAFEIKKNKALKIVRDLLNDKNFEFS